MTLCEDACDEVEELRIAIDDAELRLLRIRIYANKLDAYLERMFQRRSGYALFTPEEDDIRELIDLWKEWRANNERPD